MPIVVTSCCGQLHCTDGLVRLIGHDGWPSVGVNPTRSNKGLARRRGVTRSPRDERNRHVPPSIGGHLDRISIPGIGRLNPSAFLASTEVTFSGRSRPFRGSRISSAVNPVPLRHHDQREHKRAAQGHARPRAGRVNLRPSAKCRQFSAKCRQSCTGHWASVLS